MTKQEAEAFKKRWVFVNEFINEEIRNASTERKLQQLSSLYRLAVGMGWLDKIGRDEEQVWIRWQALRRTYDRSLRTSQSDN